MNRNSHLESKPSRRSFLQPGFWSAVDVPTVVRRRIAAVRKHAQTAPGYRPCVVARLLFLAQIAVGLATIGRPESCEAATLPVGFAETQVASGLLQPTAMSIAPDGRIFVCQQGGRLRVIKNGVLLPKPFVTLAVNAVDEGGLLGVAFDPNFTSNRFVYVYYTANTAPPHNRVSRFTAQGDLAVPGSQRVILDLNNLTNSRHYGGAIHFGRDGKLYIAVGDNDVGTNAQTLSNLFGKLLRINSNGTIPSNNPFFSTALGKNRSIWALGLRNPFTFAVQPGSGRIFLNDVGQSNWEEIDDGHSGANYGWPETEGPTSDPRFVSPVHAYRTGSLGSCAITGGTFYNPPIRMFPAGYVGTYFFADYCGGWIRRYSPSTGQVRGFATVIVQPVDLDVATDGSLYYLRREGATARGAIRRIRYVGQ
ncbi:PQQ-dependent sugar dehydrogenase [Methylotetracoccus oryzae]|uniref:PQQ-dependent sugar dehydrogenase n=1 Tax=Methylotetracoccus oryzae TaxID=1919059 RepID=UPI0011180F4E|nr:PQQ-dependent sugar dehydrogenase [Methylotetracoccus oryzae]